MSQVAHRSAKSRRKRAVRSKLFGTEQRPRVSVYRSNQHIYVQAIDDLAGETLAAATDLGQDWSGTKTERAYQAGEQLAASLKKAKISQAIFDRGHYAYHGRIQRVAEGLRDQGIEV
jgi:large subunit ribosomal protein L18